MGDEIGKSINGVIRELGQFILQKGDVWYLAFEATEFSPYALVVRNAGRYDETASVPDYLDINGNRVFIGF